jgi:hypothetical protein
VHRRSPDFRRTTLLLQVVIALTVGFMHSTLYHEQTRRVDGPHGVKYIVVTVCCRFTIMMHNSQVAHPAYDYRTDEAHEPMD